MALPDVVTPLTQEYWATALQRVLTIDGIGRRRKAEMLRDALLTDGNHPPSKELVEALNQYVNLAH